MVASASIAVAEAATGNPLAMFERQLIYVGIGVLAAYVTYQFPLSLWDATAGTLANTISNHSSMITVTCAAGWTNTYVFGL